MLIHDIQLIDRYGNINQLPERKVIIRAVPQKSALLANYPNPFNPDTWISYQLAKGNDVEIKIYNLNGQLVRNLHLGYRAGGYYLSKEKAAYWDGKNEAGEAVSSGIYFYHLSAGGFQVVRKMAIIK